VMKAGPASAQIFPAHPAAGAGFHARARSIMTDRAYAGAGKLAGNPPARLASILLRRKIENNFSSDYPRFQESPAMKMKKTRLALLFAVGCGYCFRRFAADTVVEEIICRVNNEIITRSEYIRQRDQLKQEIQQAGSGNADRLFGEEQRDVLEKLIDQQLLLQKGKTLALPGHGTCEAPR